MSVHERTAAVKAVQAFVLQAMLLSTVEGHRVTSIMFGTLSLREQDLAQKKRPPT
jgi:nucleoid DNA-binding protein